MLNLQGGNQRHNKGVQKCNSKKNKGGFTM